MAVGSVHPRRKSVCEIIVCGGLRSSDAPIGHKLNSVVRVLQRVAHKARSLHLFLSTTMEHTLESLPRSLLTTVLQHVVRVANPGSVFRVALVSHPTYTLHLDRTLYRLQLQASKALLYAVSTLEGLWLERCQAQGWRWATAY
jgi:hypothetical protein